MEPNLFGKMIFFTWPIVIYWLFKKNNLPLSISLSIVLPSILLPAYYAFDLPLIPPLDRGTLTSITLMVILFLKRIRNPIFKPGLWNKIFICYLLIIVTSTLLNTDNIESGGVYLRGSSPYDALSNVIIFILSFMPFILGRNFLNKPEDTISVFKVLIISALIYTIPMMYEIRMSPQINTMVYGYFPHEFVQQIRAGGYRPVVFIGHGLTLAFWFVTCIIAGLALYKSKLISIRFFPLLLVYLIVVLILCKTVSVVIYLVIAILIIFFCNKKRQLKYSIFLALFIFIYPFNVITQTIKDSDVLDFVSSYSEDRAQSLQTRFENEKILLDRALERPWFGWSGWGRNRVYAWGKDISITDGRWMIEFGIYGSLGFIFFYLLLIYPLFVAMRNYRFIEDDKQKLLFATLAIILAISIFNSIPNSGMMPVHLLIAGTILGQAELIEKKRKLANKKRTNINETT